MSQSNQIHFNQQSTRMLPLSRHNPWPASILRAPGSTPTIERRSRLQAFANHFPVLVNVAAIHCPSQVVKLVFVPRYTLLVQRQRLARPRVGPTICRACCLLLGVPARMRSVQGRLVRRLREHLRCQPLFSPPPPRHPLYILIRAEAADPLPPPRPTLRAR